MKSRLTAFFLCLPLLLASCSLAEDITPPPGYQSPTFAAPLVTETPVAEATAAMPAATPASAAAPASLPPASPIVAGTVTISASSLGVFTGSLINGSGGLIPTGQNVTLVGLDPDKTGSYQKVLEQQAQVNQDGTYSFSGVAVSLNRAFLAVAELGRRGIPVRPGCGKRCRHELFHSHYHL